ncbi:hypothetical protein REPUB_Repub08aG0158400 [Reevesia pubescens]
MVKVKTTNGEAIYGCRERVRAGDGVRFEVYSREEKVLRGVFRREEAQKWKMECKSAVDVVAVADNWTVKIVVGTRIRRWRRKE